jgi:hypothetical protein
MFANKKLKANKLFFSSLFFILIIHIAKAQEDSLTIPNTKFSKFPFFLEDVFISGGINHGGIWMTKYKDQIDYKPGFQIGVEHYRSVGARVFLNYGIQYAQKNFTHNINDIDFSINALQGIIFVGYEIPEFRDYDFRFLVGTHLNYHFNANKSGQYSIAQSLQPDVFKYNTADFNGFDYGLFFGLSMERKNFYWRISSTIGLNNLDKKDQGMYHGFQMNLGYFFLRGLRN